MTFGPRGTYANVGIPGSGLSYRTRVDRPAVTPGRSQPVRGEPQFAPRSPMQTPGVVSIPGTEIEVRSADVGTLTTSGLDELKGLIIEATTRRAELQVELARRISTLKLAAMRLHLAEFFVIRLFTKKIISRLVDSANQASDELDDTRTHLEGCFVEVDFPFDAPTQASYAELIHAFESLRTANRIWDITATAAIDSVRQRTTAINAITRVPVRFDFANSEIVRSQYQAMRLGNVGGRDLQIYPGFIMMREGTRDFALIEFAQLECNLAQSNYIEEEAVPADAQQIGVTWKRANKDGSRDLRFNSNYQIPVMRYGALAFSSSSGLAEVYQISSYDKAADFARAIGAHKRALENLTTPNDLPALPSPSDYAEQSTSDDVAHEAAFAAKPPGNPVVDWSLLSLILIGLIWGTLWIRHRHDLTLAPAAPVQIAAPPMRSIQKVGTAAKPAKTRYSSSKSRRHHNHHRHAQTGRAR
jgi:hypothetical protein